MQQLMLEQQRIVEEQRQAQGKLPDQVLTEQGRKNLASRPEQIQAGTLPSRAPAGQENARPASAFKCDGRTHCSQMRSYEEAVFFIRNCPGTKMDGNHDGVPCERQFGK